MPNSVAPSSQLSIKVKAPQKSDMDLALQDSPPLEEHFILRLPQDLANKLAPHIKARTLTNDVSFSFNDQRKGTFKCGSETYTTNLVDLPCITESLKTVDNKQFYKIADISQMLLVQDPLNHMHIAKDGIWPHGISGII
jgi:transcription initiation factor TFIID subunit 7